MITASPHSLPETRRENGARSWKHQLREAFRDVDALLTHLGLTRNEVDVAASTPFPLLVPRSFVARMRHGDPHDPLLRQILPVAAEADESRGWSLDPVGDLARTRGPGLIHKYRGRVLLIATASCAVHCRYCFRRHFPYAEELAARDNWSAAVDVIAADASIEEVILSGGDPLSLATSKLRGLTDALAAIPHLRRLRIHTRWPIVLPQRVDAELVDWLQQLPWPTVVVIHANHAAEFDADVASALHRLRRAGATLLNQAVLLRGVNDDADALRKLSLVLSDHGVMPYYLHLLDRVAGAAHFEVDAHRGRALIRALRAQLPGYLVPRLAREDAGRSSKTVLA